MKKSTVLVVIGTLCTSVALGIKVEPTLGLCVFGVICLFAGACLTDQGK